MQLKKKWMGAVDGKARAARVGEGGGAQMAAGLHVGTRGSSPVGVFRGGSAAVDGARFCGVSEVCQGHRWMGPPTHACRAPRPKGTLGEW